MSLQDLSDTNERTGDSPGESCYAKINTLSSGSKQGGCERGGGCAAQSGGRGFTVRASGRSPSSLLHPTSERERVSARGIYYKGHGSGLYVIDL